MGRLLPGLLFFVALGVGAAPNRFVHLDVDDGLSHNSVYAITQDRQGFIWLGTADGLNRFDGYEFRVYRQGPADSDSLSGNSITALLLDAGGRLWIGTELGINRYLPDQDAFRRYGPPAGSGYFGRWHVTVLHQDSSGAIRVGTRAGVLRYEPGQDRFAPELVADPAGGEPVLFVNGIQEAPDGSVWVLGADRTGAKKAHVLRPDEPPRVFSLSSHWGRMRSFLIDRVGRFWTHFSDHGGISTTGLMAPSAAPATTTTAAAELDDGSLWFGTTAGLYLRPGDGGELRHEYVDPLDRSWLRNYVRVIFEDDAGSIWVGTYTGVYRHDPGARPFRRLGHDPNAPDSLSGSAVSTITGDDAHLWVGTFGGGITRIDRATGEVTHLRHQPDDRSSLASDVVWHLLLEDGVLWIGTDMGLARLDTATGHLTRVPGPDGAAMKRVTYILRGLDDALWLGTGNGLYRYDPRTRESRRYPVVAFRDGPSEGTSDTGLSILWQQDPHTIWIGTDSGQLNRLSVTDGVFHHYMLSGGDGELFVGEGVWDLLPTTDGGLWVGHGGGLHRFNTESGTGRNFGISAGLPGSVVYALARDGRGDLWLGTNRGLARFDPDTEQVRNYITRDGLANMEFNRHADWIDADGAIYFGGINGLTWFRPEEVRTNRQPPPVALTELRKYGARGIRPVNPRGRQSLVLGPHDYGFSARFAALSFISPQQNRYAYRLLGLGERWIPADESRLARYTNLRPGRYTFQVRGSNNDGIWSEQPLNLGIEVVPAFWETNWFYSAVALSLTLLLYAGYRYRLRQLHRLEQVRLQIASDLHDDVSSDLSGIAIAADMVSHRPRLSEADRNLLTEAAATARRTSSALRDVVWYINPEQDTLQALVERLRSVSNSLLASHDRRFRADIDRPDRRLRMEMRRNILLIFKEAVHNVVRHACAETVEIEMTEDNARFRVVVNDDGYGFDAAEFDSGHGTGSMRRRADAIGGGLEVTSRPGGGTRVVLVVDITDSRDGTGRGGNIS